IYLFVLVAGVHSITTVSKVSVEAGKPISIPCLYESQYIDHVKYLCKGHIWGSCRYAVKTNTPDPSGKYLISDDKIQKIFTVTINELTDKNTDYWCVVEIDNEKDYGQYFQLLVISGKCLFSCTFQICSPLKKKKRIESLNRIETGIGIVKILSIPIPIHGSVPLQAKSHQVGHQRSRSSVEVAVDQKRRGMTCWVALPGHKLGLDQPWLGRLGEGV
uniref:Immunoglobulin subtype domain-containing protein n=1 Tax=Pundamilia nyererei TaxID=303518 RepID=A0A3B4FXY2_9CICH